MAAHVEGVALCCEHATLGQNTHVNVCWKRSRAVVKTGRGGERYCRLLLCSSQLQGNCTLNCAVEYKHFPIDARTHTQTQAPTQTRRVNRTKQTHFFHRPATSILSLLLTPQRYAAPALPGNTIVFVSISSRNDSP